MKLQHINSREAAAAYVAAEKLLVDGGLVAIFVDSRCHLLGNQRLRITPAGRVQPHDLLRKGLQLGAAGYVLVASGVGEIGALGPTIESLADATRDHDCHLLDCLVIQGSGVESFAFGAPAVECAIKRLWPDAVSNPGHPPKH